MIFSGVFVFDGRGFLDRFRQYITRVLLCFVYCASIDSNAGVIILPSPLEYSRPHVDLNLMPGYLIIVVHIFVLSSITRVEYM